MIVVFMSILWAYQSVKGEADIVDAGWAAGLGLVALYYAYVLDGYFPRRLILALLVGAWSVRLAGYLLKQRVLKLGEDGRYQALRAKWGAKAQRNFFLFFQAQGILVIILSIPFYIVATNATPVLEISDFIGILLFPTIVLIFSKYGKLIISY